ncbi:hypothetical protein EGR_03872 [Echinococcus granulosus]|uniref:Uncharacterized protein n=1 Tax=Echinococcus granulosus TaxID=6210 RepID=W6US54_ECHGR|nr:hypothetical protein EGR_03872 [Echinococcus granulosus]EUB61197.1 hypothetical protein EGR_03872 [Echinococcus granulosus]
MGCGFGGGGGSGGPNASRLLTAPHFDDNIIALTAPLQALFSGALKYLLSLPRILTHI